MGRGRAFDVDDIDAVGLERRHQAGVLGVDQVEVRGLTSLPVPAAVGIHQRLRALVPAVGTHPPKLIAGSTHEHLAQRANLVAGAPFAAPHQPLLRRRLEPRLCLGRAQRDAETNGVGVLIHRRQQYTL